MANRRTISLAIATAVGLMALLTPSSGLAHIGTHGDCSSTTYGTGYDWNIDGTSNQDVCVGHNSASGAPADHMEGFDRGDTLNGNEGQDKVLCGNGQDVCEGGAGADWVEGGAGGGTVFDQTDGGTHGDTVLDTVYYMIDDADGLCDGPGGDSVYSDDGDDDDRWYKENADGYDDYYQMDRGDDIWLLGTAGCPW